MLYETLSEAALQKCIIYLNKALLTLTLSWTLSAKITEPLAPAGEAVEAGDTHGEAGTEEDQGEEAEYHDQIWI